MKKALSLLIIIALIIGCTACLSACKQDSDPNVPTPPSLPNENENGNPGESPTITVPEYKDYGRGTVDFDKVTYERPNISEAIADFNRVSAAITANTSSIDEQINMIVGLEEGYTNVMTMLALTEIYTSKDASDAVWSAEYEYISTNYPAFSQAVEALFVAAARSPNRKLFEDNYFKMSLEEYLDGGEYTDRVVELMSQEAAKEAEYSALSTKTVTITYNNITATVDEILSSIEESYGKSSTEYQKAERFCAEAFNFEINRLSRPIYVELIKLRRLIADELGYDSYAQLAYKELGHEYTTENMLAFFSGIRDYIFPVCNQLWFEVFHYYFRENMIADASYIDVINGLYEIYKSADIDLHDIYSYMLQHKLYDIAPSSPDRFSGAFTTYIEGNSSPFVFVSTSDTVADYLTLAHEFGHFADGYVNNGGNTSLDLSEISSQGLEYLTLLKLKEYLPEDTYRYLEYRQLFTAMNSMIEQGIIAAFEHYAYSIPYEKISEASLNEALFKAKLAVTGAEYSSSFDEVLMVHTIEYPFYVQSYCTSMTATLELFFKEAKNSGEGISIYKSLIAREEGRLPLSTVLSGAGLSSPFDNKLLMELADEIYYYIVGTHYFNKLPSGSGNAA